MPNPHNRKHKLNVPLDGLPLNNPQEAHAGPSRQFFSSAGFGAGIVENLEELFKPAPRGQLHPGLLTSRNRAFGGFWDNLRAVVSGPKAGPAAGTSGEPVAEIWSRNPRFTRVQALSIALHAAVLALLIAPLLPMFKAPSVTKPVTDRDVAIDLSKYDLRKLTTAKVPTGGGGAHDVAPATRGKAPKFSKLQLAAPNAHPVLNARVTMTPTLVGDPSTKPPDVNSLKWGNPLSAVMGNSMGPGNGNGIGGGNGSGLGDGDGGGFGKQGPVAGYGGYGSPQCLYCPTAQFSDEAVRAKDQGVVLVNALITSDGRATDIRVVKGLGLGLDENAVAAVKTWRFKPATGPDGKPAAVEQTIEVEFRLI